MIVSVVKNVFIEFLCFSFTFCKRKIFHVIVIPYSTELNKGSDANPSAERSVESLECPKPWWECGAAVNAQHISSD